MGPCAAKDIKKTSLSSLSPSPQLKRKENITLNKCEDDKNEENNKEKVIKIEKKLETIEEIEQIDRIKSVLYIEKKLDTNQIIETEEVELPKKPETNVIIETEEKELPILKENNENLNKIEEEFDPEEKQFKRIHDYVLHESLGKGAFATVFKAYDMNRDVYAVKVVAKILEKQFPKLKDSLEIEQRAMIDCECENVVEFIERIETDNNYYFVLEYCNEGTLENMIKEKKRLSEIDAINILEQLLKGFKVMHSYGYFHRDFKSQNVFIKNGVAKIGDFGMAKQAYLATTVAGTPVTMAPEVLNHQKYSHKADLWSLGVVFYEMLFGYLPFQGINEYKIKQAINKNEIDYTDKNMDNSSNKKISLECIDLLKKIFIIDPNFRINWEDVEKHKVFQKYKAKENKFDIRRSHFEPKSPMQIFSPKKLKNKMQSQIYHKNLSSFNVNEKIKNEVINEKKAQECEKVLQEKQKRIFQLIQFDTMHLNDNDLPLLKFLVNKKIYLLITEKNIYNIDNFEIYINSKLYKNFLDAIEDLYTNYTKLYEELQKDMLNKSIVNINTAFKYEIENTESKIFEKFYKESLIDLIFFLNAKDDNKSIIICLDIINCLINENMKMEDYDKERETIYQMNESNRKILLEKKIEETLIY